MERLFFHLNVFPTCLALLSKRGYTTSLRWVAARGRGGGYGARKEEFLMIADNPVQLLGMAAVRDSECGHLVQAGAGRPQPDHEAALTEIFRASQHTLGAPQHIVNPGVPDQTLWAGDVVLHGKVTTLEKACLVVLQHDYGCRLRFYTTDPEKHNVSTWEAERDGFQFLANEPAALLGLAVIHAWHGATGPQQPYWWKVDDDGMWDALYAAYRSTIRPANGADAEKVATIFLDSRRTYLPYAPLTHSDDEVRKWIAEILIPSGGVLVAEASGGALLGMAAFSQEEDCGWIQHLYVGPSSTGFNVGTQLLREALRKVRPPVRLWTFQANTGARRFYEQHGFRAIAFGDGSGNDEQCPDVLYEWNGENAGLEKAVS